MAKLTIPSIEGAFPAIDRKKIAKPFVMDGSNYLVDLDGPKSAFGWQKPHERFLPSQLMQSFSIGTTIFYFGRPTDETYLQISQVSWPDKQILPVGRFISADLTRPRLNLPWTHALVGTYHFFANRTWGVLRYDTLADNWEDVTATIGLTNVFFIAESGGRLCTLSQSFATWSAIDDGMDNVPSLATGAGAQGLSLVGTLEQDSDYLGIQKVSRGFLSFTTKGVMRSELIDSINPFRHLPGETKYTPLTPWCITKITDTDVIMLTRFGLFTSADGVQFQEFQPLQNEYFKLVEIPPLLSLSNGFIALHYSRSRDELYVSFAQSQSVSQYTKAWVLYIKRDSWGQMNHVHKGFVFLDIDAIGIKFQQAFIDSTGTPAYLNDASISQSLEQPDTVAHYVQKTLQYVPHQIEGVNVMSTTARMGGFSIVPYPEIARFYTPGFRGADLVVNGNFDVDTDWIKYGAVTISGGVVNCVTDLRLIAANITPLIVGLLYDFSFDYTMTGSNKLRINNSLVNGVDTVFVSETLGASGTITGTFVAINDAELSIQGDSATFTGTIDNLVVRFQPSETVNDLVQYSLNSFIEVGLFRFTDELVNDQFSFITNVAISCLDIADSTGSIFDDWLNDYPADIFEDWLAEAETFEDWGEAVVAGSTYLQQIRGSLDGYVTFEDQLVDLEEVQLVGKTKFCTCANSGIFESVILTAYGVGESYHLKTLELNGMIAGRL